MQNNTDEKSNNSKYFTRGGQITFHNWRMLFQINSEIFKIYFIFLIFLSAILIFLITPKDVLSCAIHYWYSKFELLMYRFHFPLKTFQVFLNGKVYTENAISFLSQYQFIEKYQQITAYVIFGFLVSFVTSFFVSLIFVKWLKSQGRAQAQSKFLRGATLQDSKIVAKQIFKNKDASDLRIDYFPLIKNSEVQHFLIHGTTGTGKGQLLQKLLDGIRKRGDRVILYDKGCSFTPLYYQEKNDILLNPFDERCANWDLWSDAQSEPDFENMAESLIPIQGDGDPFWINAARSIFSTAAYKMKDDPKRSIDKLLNILTTAPLHDLEAYLSGTQAATLASDKIEKTAMSIRTVLSAYLKSLRFLKGLDQKNNPKFSIRDWIKKDNGNEWLFISSNGEQHASLRPLISMWLSQSSLSILSLPENRDRRIWLIIDELPSLHRLAQLPETIAEVRKFGGCFVLGMQSFSQLEKCYDRHAAREIFDLLNTRFFFRSPSSDMAKLVSSELGSQEVEDMREQYSYGQSRIRDGISIGRQKTTQSIATYSELMDLPDLTCFAKLPSGYPIVKLNILLQNRPSLTEHFLERKIATEDCDTGNESSSEEADDLSVFKNKKISQVARNQKTKKPNELADDHWENALPNIEKVSLKKAIDKAMLEL